MMKNVLSPLEAPYSEEIAAALAQYPQRDGYVLSLFRVFANSARFLKKGVLNLLDKGSPICLMQRELIILRICANNHCEYEWGVHVSAFAKVAGLSEEQVLATCFRDVDLPCWNTTQSLLLRVVDELCSNAIIQDETYSNFQSQWTVEQQLEILALCGNYHTITFVANTARIPVEPFAARFI